MQDRISNHPGRWLLTPVQGESNVYDMTRADDPTVQGTPLNKDTLLTDPTAAAINTLFGSTPDTPNDALAALTSMLSTIGIEKNAKLEVLNYVGAGGKHFATNKTLTFSIKPRIVFWLYPGNNWTPEGTYGMVWMQNQTVGPSFQENQYSYYIIFTYTESSKQLQWRLHAPGGYSSTSGVPYYMMDRSNVTYYVFAIGEK